MAIARLLLVLLALLATAREAPSANCNSAPNVSYGPSGAREYQAWCESCCGVFSMSGGNPFCSPGSNWGCKGSGSPAAGPGVYNNFYQMGYQLGQGIGKSLFGDPQEEGRIRARAEQKNRQMMRSLDELSQEQIRQEDPAHREAASQARLLGDRQRQEAISSLQGISQTDGELTLRPATEFFNTPGNPKGKPSSPIDSSVVDLRHLDADKPVAVDNTVLREPSRNAKKEKPILSSADCGKRKAVRDRIAAGLPVQEEGIRRTEAQLDAAQKGVGEAAVEKRQVLLQRAIEEANGYAKDVLTSAQALRSQVELLKDLEIGKEKRDLLIRSLNTVIFDGEDLAKAAQAGKESGEALNHKVDSLFRRILSLGDKMLMQSGIAEKAGEELSEKLGGPLGALGFRGARLSIDITVALGKGMVSEKDLETAKRNLDTMRNQHRRARQHIPDLDRELTEGCTVDQQAAQ